MRTGLKSGNETKRNYLILKLMIKHGLGQYFIDKPILTLKGDGEFYSANDFMLHSSVNLMDEGTSPLKAGGINWTNVEGKVRSTGNIMLSSVGTYGTFNVRETIDQQPLKDFAVFKVGASLNQRINIQRFLGMTAESKKAFLRFDNTLSLEEIDELLKEIMQFEARSAFDVAAATEPVSNQLLAHIHGSTGLPIYIGEQGTKTMDVTEERSESLKQSLGTNEVEYFEDPTTKARVICIGKHR